jgi:ABC-type amino acid transport substrate-binding protein
MVPEGSGSLLGGIVLKALAIIFSKELLYGAALFFVVLVLAAHIIWLLETKKVEAVVYGAPALQHYASKKGNGKVRVVGLIFKEKSYGIILPEHSELRDRINIALLKLIESGAYEQLNKKWFGS